MCIHCNNPAHLKYTKNYLANKIKRFNIQKWVGQSCHLKEPPIFKTCNVLEENVATAGETMQNDVHIEAF